MCQRVSGVVQLDLQQMTSMQVLMQSSHRQVLRQNVMADTSRTQLSPSGGGAAAASGARISRLYRPSTAQSRRHTGHRVIELTFNARHTIGIEGQSLRPRSKSKIKTRSVGPQLTTVLVDIDLGR